MDYNKDYPEDAEKSAGSNVNGQPSVIYSAVVDISELAQWPIMLNLTGHGSTDGSDGNLYTDISSLSSALRIVDSVLIEKNL